MSENEGIVNSFMALPQEDQRRVLLELLDYGWSDDLPDDLRRCVVTHSVTLGPN